MSTQSGKPLNPINHVPRKAREASVTEPPGSPYAPKRARQRAGTEGHDVESDRDPLRLPYTPKQARAQPVTSGFAAGDDAEQPAAARRDQIMSDHDLERLEASLRQLQRQESATRLRASNLAPVPRLAPVHASGRRHSGERFGDGFRSPRSLEPARPPPAMSRRNMGTPVGILVASILVATVAYYFAVGGWVPSSEPAPPQTTSSDPTVVVPPSPSTGQHVFRPTMPQDKDRATSAQNEISSQQSTETSQPARPSGDETAGRLPGEPGGQVGSASKASRVLDPEEINLFMKQGEQFIAAGDVGTARIVFQRAAEAGDANAAMALGATYDPTVLAKLGVMGLGADVEKARTWYQKAESLGSTEATRRLAILANR
jgi:hypothetical protein